MSKSIKIHEGVIRLERLEQLEAFRVPRGLVSSYFISLEPRRFPNTEALRIAVKNAFNGHRERLEQLKLDAETRSALHRDWEQARELALASAGERLTRSLACFGASESQKVVAFRCPWPIRDRAFFENQFVVWPWRQVLDQNDRYAVCLVDQDDARLFLFQMEQIEEVSYVFDEVPGKVRFPDPWGELEYLRKHVVYYHRHFDKVNGMMLRLFEREHFAHLIIGGLAETLPDFESRLHRYLRDRVVARWKIELRAPLAEILEKTRGEEEQVLERLAASLWKRIQECPPARKALGPDAVFAALWRRNVDSLLIATEVVRAGYRCTACTRLVARAGPCPECGGQTAERPDVFEEAVHDAVDQSSQVRYWKDPVLREVDSIAALTRF